MVDPVNTPLGKMLLDHITPAVMVLRTPLVEESCRRNGLSFIEMLNPFCNFNNIDVPVRTASDQPYRLRRFKLRLFYASEIRLANMEVAKERLKQIITHAGDKDISDMCLDLPDIGNTESISKRDFVPSWFQIFNKELVDTAAFSEHEAFDHPVACLVAVSSKDKDPIEKFVDLFNTNQLPSILNGGAMDPKILKYFVLVHDNEPDTLEKATGILSEMRRTFGVNDCRLLCINSSTSLNENQEKLWALYGSNASHDQQFGSYLNLDDIEELRNTIQDLSSKHIIPHMELKIRVLNQQVSVTRKGFRNQIKNLWWRKGKEDGPENDNGPMYTFSSIESQIRVLGDYAFMLQDYELALSNYRLISTDYKLDKAWRHFAGVQEMMGLCYFMLDQSRKDAEYCMESAFSTYSKIPSGVRNATRCGIWWAEMLKARDQYKDAAGVYFRIFGEEPLHLAVMLEQASQCYFLSKPVMLRKYGFHLVLSGDLYKKCNQIKHAIRTYRGALSVFEGTSWMHIRDHIHFHIGKWYAFLGIFDEAIKHLLEVLGCGHQSRVTQELFLTGFLQVIQETGKTFEILRLQLPVISFPLTKVLFEDHRTYASASAEGVEESLWESLEDDIIPSLSVMKTNWLDSQPKVIPKKYKESNVCVAGEAIKVDVNFRNPLQIPLSISNVSLLCEYSAESDEANSDANSLSVDGLCSNKLSAVSVSGDYTIDSSLFTLSEVDVLMRGGEAILVQLQVTPKIEGTLKVVGVKWKLSSSVVGVLNFNSDSFRKNISRRKMKMKQKTKDNLKFLVIKSLPRLEGIIHNLPKTVYAGDLRRLTLEIKNPSKIPLKNLKMRVNYPRFISIADHEDVKSDFPSCLEGQTNLAQNCSQVDILKGTNNIFVFPETATICWDVPLVWPLWFRAAVTGNISLYITIYYEMEDKSTFITYRTLRMQYDLKVLPSLEVSFQLRSCPSRWQEFLVQMDIINRTSSKSFQITQLSSVGRQWELELLQSINTLSSILLPGQALSCFFKLQNGRTDNMCAPSTSGRADAKLRDRDAKESFDVSISPINVFHHHEKMLQKKLEQDYQNTVDFILIAESFYDNEPDTPSSSEVFTHHTCHCRIDRTSPISWLMNCPQIVKHDFSTAFCKINLSLTVSNSVEDDVSVRINTQDSIPSSNAASNSASVSGNEVGWYNLSQLSDIKVTSDVTGIRTNKSAYPEGVPPFVWSGLTSTRVNLSSYSSSEIPLQICVFSPGTYDLSSYSLDWNLLFAANSKVDENGSKVASGTCTGHSYHITVLQEE